MILQKVLTVEKIKIGMKASEKEAILAEIVDWLVECGDISDKEEALKALSDREKQMSTGMKYGIAIPHGKAASIQELQVGMLIEQEGREFNALDGEPTQIFITTLSPENTGGGAHLQFLAEISELLKDEDRREKLKAAKTSQEAVEVLFQ